MFLFHADGADAGLISGLIHPVFGLDHLFAMVSVGIVSSRLGEKNLWRIPSAFVLAMAFGGILGIFKVFLPFTEYGIAVSVIFLGIAIFIANRQTSAILITSFVLFFGIFHGHAHGTEIPKSISPTLYTIGFLISTATLHIFGLIIGEVATLKENSLKILRASGIGIAIFGIYLIL